MKFILHIFLIAGLSLLSAAYLPWWGACIIAFVVSFVLQQKEGTSFLAGFIGLLLCWGISALMINITNESILASKMGELLGGLSAGLLVLITAVLGGLLGGMASWSGRLARDLVNV
ncbi:MAG TPA: hypothetical protein VJ953_07370 [Saprospiraceae bacterium]|nr:hypothetical protein [Saprospiraceae bacterium]